MKRRRPPTGSWVQGLHATEPTPLREPWLAGGMGARQSLNLYSGGAAPHQAPPLTVPLDGPLPLGMSLPRLAQEHFCGARPGRVCTGLRLPVHRGRRAHAS